MRGKHDVVRGGAGDVGITPACAGKTDLRSKVGDARQDHPRVCGENRAKLQAKYNDLGSPPRVRGKRSMFAGNIFRARITPACAGKTAI